MSATLSIAEAATEIGCSERWLVEQIRSGRFRARKIGRSWRMTPSDVEFALDRCSNRVSELPPTPAPAPPSPVTNAIIADGLTPTTRRRLEKEMRERNL